jgi:hypothetical protein
MKTSKYFAAAEEMINQNYLSADGWENAASEDGQWEGAFGDELNADAAPVATPMTSAKSQPYTIVIANTTTTDISNVVVLDAAKTFSNFAVSGVSFSYEPNTITYAQFLATIISGRPFQVGQLRLIASNTSESIVQQQVLGSVNIETKDPNGNLIQMSFIPEYDSYQYLKNQTDIYYKFNVDSLTKLTIATLYASTTLKIRMYPSLKINPFNQLKGGSGAVASASPQVNKALAKR